MLWSASDGSPGPPIRKKQTLGRFAAAWGAILLPGSWKTSYMHRPKTLQIEACQAVAEGVRRWLARPYPGLPPAGKPKGRPLAEFEAEWTERQPDEYITRFYGAWPNPVEAALAPAPML